MNTARGVVGTIGRPISAPNLITSCAVRKPRPTVNVRLSANYTPHCLLVQAFRSQASDVETVATIDHSSYPFIDRYLLAANRKIYLHRRKETRRAMPETMEDSVQEESGQNSHRYEVVPSGRSIDQSGGVDFGVHLTVGKLVYFI